VDRLVTASIVYPQPMLVDQLSNIARMIDRADQKPGRDAVQRYDDLMKELAAIKAEMSRVGI
jgi:Mor family transcriptional regulator